MTHTTHYACEEQIQKDGGDTKCCHCNGHECSELRIELEERRSSNDRDKSKKELVEALKEVFDVSPNLGIVVFLSGVMFLSILIGSICENIFKFLFPH